MSVNDFQTQKTKMVKLKEVLLGNEHREQRGKDTEGTKCVILKTSVPRIRKKGQRCPQTRSPRLALPKNALGNKEGRAPGDPRGDVLQNPYSQMSLCVS